MSEDMKSKYPEHIEGESQDSRPGLEEAMETKPVYDDDSYQGSHRLQGKVALITGGDSGIGRAVAVAFAKEGAKIFISYKDETTDAEAVQEHIRRLGGDCAIHGVDIGDKAYCGELVARVIDRFGGLDILVNNAAEQHPQDSISKISEEQLERTFRTNVFSMFFLVQAALPFMDKGSSIINTASVTAYVGSPEIIDYAATNGAVTAFTRSLAGSLAEQHIRVNQVAPGPIWTPLIPSTFGGEQSDGFGEDTELGRAGQPLELAEAYVFLAWERASSYITGQTLHVNGGSFVSS